MIIGLPLFIFRNFILPYLLLVACLYGTYNYILSEDQRVKLKKTTLYQIEQVHNYLKKEIEKAKV